MNPASRTYTAKDGEEYTFFFNHGGLIAAERAATPLTGLATLMQGLGEGSLHAIVSLIKGGLSANHPEITYDDAWALWESEGQNFVKAMAEALSEAMPLVAKMLGVKLRPPKAAKNGTGTPSSPPGSKKAKTKQDSSIKRPAASLSS